jgi:Anti-sigma factor NepR
MKIEVELRAAMLAAIGSELRLMYDHIVAEGVPERFAAILHKLDESSERRASGTL